MTLPTTDQPARILVGDVRECLRALPDGCVQCVATSPPYWGLRDYGVAGQIGLEKTPDEYVAVMVDVFREVKRVLRDDGVLWLNLGDSYAGGGRGGNPDESPHRKQATNTGSVTGITKNPWPVPVGLKAKDLVGVPWRVAFALQADGWYLRSDIIWHKPAAMPESVTDRPSKSHEYVFMFSKKARYFYDAQAIAEPASQPNGTPALTGQRKAAALQSLISSSLGTNQGAATRNKRTVWSIVSDPYPETHFATFPPALVLPMILAGTPEKGCCPACGAPWRRVVEKERRATRPGGSSKVVRKHQDGTLKTTDQPGLRCSTLAGIVGNRDPRRHVTEVQTTGWQPSCKCPDADPLGSIVLDPFAGSGTTLAVAVQNGRRAIGIELNPDYASLAEKRLHEPLGGDLFKTAPAVAPGLFAESP